jgi:hypothetical protein
MLIGRRFIWPGLSQEVRKFLRNYDIYGRMTIWREKRHGLLKPLPIPERIWSELSIDFITRLPLSGSNQADTIIVITDWLLKSMIFEAMTSTITEAVAERLLSSFIRYYGLPLAIVSDRGP